MTTTPLTFYPPRLFAPDESLTLGEIKELARTAFRSLVEYARAPLPIMVCKEEAARLCEMSVSTYDKYARKGLLPTMNAAGRVSVKTLEGACLRLDGIADAPDVVSDPAERALREWEQT